MLCMPLLCAAVQHEALPQALVGVDILCQAKSGMGKTAVFVLSTLNQLAETEDVSVLVMCHTRELAYQIGNEFNRFTYVNPCACPPCACAAAVRALLTTHITFMPYTYAVQEVYARCELRSCVRRRAA